MTKPARERGRLRKAWGWSAAKPQGPSPKIISACGAGDSDGMNADCDEYHEDQPIETICRPLRGLDEHYRNESLGFRCAPPRALCCRLLRRLKRGVMLQRVRESYGH
ncbi:MAG TPA: hypothetical protein VKE91_06340 [Blastocatellia bacterium]|nr:hypothetical protein [Blastocatellia bacterium]